MTSVMDTLFDPMVAAVWIGGVFVIASVLLAFRLQSRREDRKKDIEQVYRPMLDILKDSMDYSNEPDWTIDTRIQDLYSSGYLPKRIHPLVMDCEMLTTILQLAKSCDEELRKKVNQALETEVNLIRSDTMLASRLNASLFDALRNGLVGALMHGSTEELKDLVELYVKNPAISGDKTLFALKADSVFRQVLPSVINDIYARNDAVRGFQALGRQVEGGLVLAISGTSGQYVSVKKRISNYGSESDIRELGRVLNWLP